MALEEENTGARDNWGGRPGNPSLPQAGAVVQRYGGARRATRCTLWPGAGVPSSFLRRALVRPAGAVVIAGRCYCAASGSLAHSAFADYGQEPDIERTGPAASDVRVRTAWLSVSVKAPLPRAVTVLFTHFFENVCSVWFCQDLSPVSKR